jgi:hypothetical protein
MTYLAELWSKSVPISIHVSYVMLPRSLALETEVILSAFCRGLTYASRL